MSDQFELEVPSHEQWVGLPLEGDVDAEAAAVVDGMVGGIASADFIDQTTAMIAGISRVARHTAEQALELQRPTIAAWMLLPAPRLLQAGPLAFLRAGPLGTTDGDDEALASVVDVNAERHGSLDVEEIDTASGRALSVRFRPVHVVDGERLVGEHRIVMWPSPRDELLLYLSFYVVDLLEGGRAARPLAELARSISWRIA